MLLMLIVLITMFGMFTLSNHFTETAFNVANQTELEQAYFQAELLMEAYNKGEVSQEELHQITNPSLNAGNVFWMLLTKNKATIAYSENGVPYFGDDRLSKYIELLDRDSSVYITQKNMTGMALIMGHKTQNGYILVGKPATLFYGATSNFRLTLLLWLIPFIIFLLLISYPLMHFLARPVNLLTQAAARLTKGEIILWEDNLPGELGELATAFNEMSKTIAGVINHLNAEKETLQLVLDGLSEGIIAIANIGELVHVNDAAEQLLGGSQCIVYQTVVGRLKQSIKTGENLTDKIEYREDVLSYTITQLSNVDGDVVAIALIRNIKQQERLEKTRRDYVANISHELRTPLANMRGLAEGLRDELVTEREDRLRYYGMIVEEVKRLSRMVNDLLELSGLQSGTVAFEMEKVDSMEIMWDLYSLNQKVFEEQGKGFVLDIPQEELPLVHSNEDRLSQVLTIFLDNARKFTKQGGTVTIGAMVVEKGVRFFVRDTGIGMDEQTQKLAFDRFHQAEHSHSGKGSGLGLSIAKEILNKLNIEIVLVSALGEGSEFSFTVPFYCE